MVLPLPLPADLSNAIPNRSIYKATNYTSPHSLATDFTMTPLSNSPLTAVALSKAASTPCPMLPDGPLQCQMMEAMA